MHVVTEQMIIQSRVLEYLNQHRDEYDEYELMGIENFAKHPNLKQASKADGIREILDELGLIPDSHNIYVSFIDLINQQFGIDGKHILEVGGGIIPRLAKRIHLKQNSGSITVYDPRLSTKTVGNDRLILKKEMFHRDTPTTGIDLLVGLMPCKGAEPLIDNAVNNRKDFMLWLCEGGPHGDFYDYFETDEEWIDSTISHAEYGVERQEMGKLRQLRLSDFPEYPIIYNQR